MQSLSENLFLFEDTCNVYIVRSGDEAVLIDFGSGDVLDRLHELGIERVTDVLMTHHHRDQGQGLSRAVREGIRIWVPQTEQELFSNVEQFWQTREIFNNYNMRQDRFSLIENVPIDGVLQDYECCEFGGRTFTVVPTPGHTVGSLTLMVEVDSKQLAFTGDLIAGAGQVWSLSATQWTYNGAEGVAMSVLSLLDLKDRQPDVLLPSHGEVMDAPASAIDLLVSRLWQLLQLRGQHRTMLERRENPYEAITPHLLKHREIVANTYVLLSESGKALFIDYGYDFWMGLPSGSDRAARRPWLYSLPALKKHYGVEKIDVVIPTHFHDDHVAGINLLRVKEGAQVWATDLFADILEQPSCYDLPCLWYDPIKVDRRLKIDTPIQWEEYTLKMHPLPGHTRYAVAIEFEVDGYRVLATGDQYQGSSGLELNYVYGNRFQASDYILSAELYKRVRPDVILTGHWEPLWVTAKYLGQLVLLGGELARLHRDLLPHTPDLGTEGFLTRLFPYQTLAGNGEIVDYQVDVTNPFPYPADAAIQVITPTGWELVNSDGDKRMVDEDGRLRLHLEAGITSSVHFQVVPPRNFVARRARITVDLTVDGRRFGQQGEALVSSLPK